MKSKSRAKYWAVLLLLVMSMALVACGGDQPAAEEAAEQPAAEEEAPAADEAEEAEPTADPAESEEEEIDEAVSDEAVSAEETQEEEEIGEEPTGEEGGPSYAGLDQDLSGVTLRMANIGGQPYEAMYESIDVFEEETGAAVEIVFLGDGFEIDRYLKTNYAAGTVDFDVAWNHTSFMSQFVNFVEDMNQYFSEEELATFSPAIIEAATIDGKLQLIPRHADISAMHYRTDLFGDADLQAAFEDEYGYPLVPPETIEQMYDMSEFFVNQDAIQYGTQFAGKEEALAGRYYELLVANGGRYFDDEFRPIFNDEAGQMTAQWMRDLYANDLVPADTTNLLWPEVAQNFCDGNVAFYLEWYGWYSYFQDPESCQVAGQFDMLRGPLGAAGDIHTGWAGAHAFSIPLASENKEAAAQLIKFLSSQRVAYEEAQLGLLPVRDDVWPLIIEDASGSGEPLDQKRLELAQTQIAEDFFTPPLFPDWITFTDTWYPMLQSIILGDEGVQEGLDSAVEEVETLMGDLGYYE